MRKVFIDNLEVEGLVSYFAKDWNEQIPSAININDYNLKTDPSNYADSYWMGLKHSLIYILIISLISVNINLIYLIV